MSSYFLLLVLLGVTALASLIQIFFKRWLFQLGQINHLKVLMLLTNVLVVVLIIFNDYFGLPADKIYEVWFLWLFLFVVQKEMIKVSYDILAQYLIEHPIGSFVAKHRDEEGRIWGRLTVGDLNMSAVVYCGTFTIGKPCSVIVMVDLDNYGNMKEIQVISLED